MEACPIIAVTQGDPAGIGPEIIVKAFQDAAPVSYTHLTLPTKA